MHPHVLGNREAKATEMKALKGSRKNPTPISVGNQTVVGIEILAEPHVGLSRWQPCEVSAPEFIQYARSDNTRAKSFVFAQETTGSRAVIGRLRCVERIPKSDITMGGQNAK